MKRRWILLALLCAAGITGWRNHARLSLLRGQNQQLAAQAPVKPASLRPAQQSAGAHSSLPSPQPLSGRTASAKVTADAWIAWVKELSVKFGDTRWQHSPEVRDRVADLTERLTALDADQLKTVILILLAARDGDGADYFDDGLGFLCDLLAEKQPQPTLEWILRTPGLLGTNKCHDALRTAMHHWAAGDPAAARAWFRENRHVLVVVISDGTMNVDHEPLDGLLFGSAMHSTEAAMETVREFRLSAGSHAYSIKPRLRTPEQRAAIVSLLRTWRLAPDSTPEGGSGTEEFLRDVVIGEKERSAAMEDVVPQIEACRFNAEELTALMQNLDQRVASGDIPQWAEWLGRNLPDGEGRRKILLQIINAWPRSSPEQEEAADAFAVKYGLK
jgi:hypothetical protein